MAKFYAGIGSRETPEDVRNVMAHIARKLAAKGYTLRSGGADGADTAFESGATEKQIFLPWRGFNGNQSPLFDYSTNEHELFAIAREHHPAWSRLEPAAKRLHARNVCQVLGANGDSPVEFVVCWTPKGCGGGGTGQAIRIAQARNIPVYDLGSYTAHFVMRRIGL